MKKLLFVVAASFFSGAAYAQVETSATPSDDFAPKELKCTEEAISFRVNIRPGWQLGSFRPGYTDFGSNLSGFILSKNYAGEDIITGPVQLVKYENAINRQDAYPDINYLLPEKTNKSLLQTGPLANDRLFYNFYNSLLTPNFNFLTPRLN